MTMKTTMLAVVWVAMGAAIAAAHPEGDEGLHFKQHGFSIKPLKTKPADGVMTQVVAMQMPAVDGFAANVNVQLQPFAGTIDEYITLSRQQFDQFAFKVLAQKKIDADTVTLEYAGKMQGVELHWYARAVRKKGKPIVYLVTGTATTAQWSASAPALKDCVDSIKLD